jgi:peroxiredoxin
MKRFAAVLLIGLVCGLVPAASSTPEGTPVEPPAPAPPEAASPAAGRPAVGSVAPLFTVPDLDGRAVDVRALIQGKPALLVFWASWCRPCIAEIPELRGLAREFRRRGFVILGIGVTEGGESPEAQRQAAARQLVNYQLVHDSGAVYQSAWALEGIPYSVLLDAEGRIAWQGALLPADLDARVRELIVNARQAPGSPQG